MICLGHPRKGRVAEGCCMLPHLGNWLDLAPAIHAFSWVPSLLAVHIADNVLAWPWLGGGWVLAATLVFFGAWRMRDEEIPRVALLTAAFFVASSIHVRLGPGSAHLLLGGLLGVVLGRRA